MNKSDRKIIWNTCDLPECPSLDDFRAWAQAAAEHGATHVVVSWLPYSRGQLRDPRDPHSDWMSWPVWSMFHPAVFKVVVPPQLREWLPVDEAARNLDILKERCAVLKELGLKGAFFGNDPMWLPEEVYRAHPEWRGAQAELGRIAHLPYFSPCVAHPDVLRMYRQAMTDLCREVPEIDVYNFFSNDSCGGICWSTTYPGPNGPDRCRDIGVTDHVQAFFSALEEGAAAAGVSIDLNIDYLRLLFDPDPKVCASLKPGHGINSRDAHGHAWQAAARKEGFVVDQVFPVCGIPHPVRFVEELEQAFDGEAERIIVGRAPQSDRLMLDILGAYRKRPTRGPASRMDLLRGIAAGRVGEEHAEELIEVWMDLEEAAKHLAHVSMKGSFSITLTAAAMMRWLLMPLVPDMARLKPEEKTDYLRGRMIPTAAEADSIRVVLGEPGIVGEAAVWMARHAVSDAMKRSTAAAARLDKLSCAVGREEAREELGLLGLRVKAYHCVMRTLRNFIDYSHTLDVADPEHTYLVWRKERIGDNDINRASLELRNIARSEAENAVELALIIESTDRPVISMAAVAEEEDPFHFSPDLPLQLRRKHEIMMDHWPDYLELYPPMPRATPATIPAQWDW